MRVRPATLLALAAVVAFARAQGPRLVDHVDAPLVYLSLEGAPQADAAPGPVQRLLADPAFDALFGAGSPGQVSAGSGAPRHEAERGNAPADGSAGRALALVRGVLARSSGDLEIALTGVLPGAGQPLLVLRARLQQAEASRLQQLLEAPQQARDGGAGGTAALAVPHRRLGQRQTYALRSDGDVPVRDAPAGTLVELALVDGDLLVGNDGMAMEELLQAGAGARTSAAPRRVLANHPRFVALRQQLATGPGSLLVFGDWQRLGDRLQTSFDGVPEFLLKWSGLGSARCVMASLTAADVAALADAATGERGAGSDRVRPRNFAGTVLLDFDVELAPARPPHDGPRRGPHEHPCRVDGWFAAAEPVPARTLLSELPAGGLGGLVLSLDLSALASRSRRGAHMLRELHVAFDAYGLDFERNVLAQLGERGTVQLLFRKGEGAIAADIAAVYSLRAKSRKAAADLFADLRRASEQSGVARVETATAGSGRDRRSFDALLLRNRHGQTTCVSVFDDVVLLAFDVESLACMHEEYRRAARSRGRRDAAVATALQSIGGETVVGLFDVDLQPLFERLVASFTGGAALDLSRIPQRHIGYLDVQPRDGGVVLRVRVLSSG